MRRLLCVCSGVTGVLAGDILILMEDEDGDADVPNPGLAYRFRLGRAEPAPLYCKSPFGFLLNIRRGVLDATDVFVEVDAKGLNGEFVSGVPARETERDGLFENLNSGCGSAVNIIRINKQLKMD